VTKKRMIYLALFSLTAFILFAGWKLTSRTAYESAPYEVVLDKSPFQIREYPTLKLVTTSMQFGKQGNDGSFGRLFSYISGNNESDQSISMTTPVFMDMTDDREQGTMAFVIPE